jgi:hypothetical protein
MKSIQISDDEHVEMKKFYLEEYEKATSRLAHITAVLKRLGIEKPAEEDLTLASTIKKRSSPKKKPGRKPKWDLIVMKRMRQLNKPVTYEQLTDEIMSFGNMPPEKRSCTKQAVVNVVFRMRNRDLKLDTFSMGTREKYIALKSWFEAPGKIKKEYAAKVELPG